MARHAQIRMFETVGVLAVFLFLMVIAGIFYFQFQRTTIEEKVSEAVELRSAETFLRALYLPEFDCPATSGVTANCFDRLKLNAFAGLMAGGGDQMLLEYFPLFGYTTVAVSTVWERPPGGAPFRITLYDYRPETVLSQNVFRSPVLIFDGTRNAMDFGMLEVTSYRAG